MILEQKSVITFSLFFAFLPDKLAAIVLPTGIEIRLGVTNASPAKPYRCITFTNKRLRLVKIFFLVFKTGSILIFRNFLNS